MDLQPENTLGNFFNQQRREHAHLPVARNALWLGSERRRPAPVQIRHRLSAQPISTVEHQPPRRLSRSPWPQSGTLARRLTSARRRRQAIGTHDVAFYAQDRLQPSTRWYLELGARLDRDGVIDRCQPHAAHRRGVPAERTTGSAVLRGGYGLFYERTPSAAGVFDAVRELARPRVRRRRPDAARSRPSPTRT